MQPVFKPTSMHYLQRQISHKLRKDHQRVAYLWDHRRHCTSGGHNCCRYLEDTGGKRGGSETDAFQNRRETDFGQLHSLWWGDSPTRKYDRKKALCNLLGFRCGASDALPSRLPYQMPGVMVQAKQQMPRVQWIAWWIGYQVRVLPSLPHCYYCGKHSEPEDDVRRLQRQPNERANSPRITDKVMDDGE